MFGYFAKNLTRVGNVESNQPIERVAFKFKRKNKWGKWQFGSYRRADCVSLYC